MAGAAILAASGVDGHGGRRTGANGCATTARRRSASRPAAAKPFAARSSGSKDSGGPAKVGQQVFFDMKPHGENVWAGSAFNPEDGKTYSGKMTLSGDHLTTAGCVFGGLICKSFAWTRAR